MLFGVVDEIDHLIQTIEPEPRHVFGGVAPPIVPLEIIGFVAGIDPIPDRMRTMNNVSRDLAVTTLIGKWTDAIDFDAGAWST